MARSNDLGLPRVKQPASAKAPSRLPLIAGDDYCVKPDQTEDCDTDLPGGLIIENAKGGPYGSGREYDI